jgi:alcohol dehydrogenase class IV
MIELKGNWRYPTEILAGAGRLAELPGRARDLGAKRVLIVTDPGVAQLPFIASLAAGLEAAGLAPRLFKEVHPDPVEADVRAGASAFAEHEADMIVAIGGGSALDCGKAVALAAASERPLWDFEITNIPPALDRTIAPIFAVPTTAGTGSEVGRAAVITDPAGPRKVILLHPAMLPRLVILDPVPTLGLPQKLTVWTGMDALAHNLEAYCVETWHPMADGIALEGMRLIKENLPLAAADGQDIAARARMLAAAAMGATSFQKGLGAIHSLSHPIGAMFHAHHGLTNAVVMPYVLQFNRPAIEDKIDYAARCLGIEDGFHGFMGWLLSLQRELRIPDTIAALGVTEESLDQLAEAALRDPNTADNPRPADLPAFRRMLEAAFTGTLEGLSR